MLRNKRQVLTRRKALQPQNINPITRLDLIVVSRVYKRQRKHSLLLQVRLVDARKRPYDDRQTAEEAGLEGSVFAGGTLTVVVVADNDPFDALVAVVCSSLRDRSVLASDLVLDLVGFAVLSVDRAD